MRVSYFIVLIILAPKISVGQNINNLFDRIRPCFELGEFIAQSEFVDNHEEVSRNLEQAFREQGFSMMLVPVSVKESNQFVRYETKDKAISLSVYEDVDGSILLKLWKKLLTEKSLKSDMRNDQGGSTYFKIKTNNKGGIGALIFTGRNLIDLEIELPFSVPNNYDDLDSEKKSYINKEYEKLYDMLMMLARIYVLETEFIYYQPPGHSLSVAQRLYGFVQFWTEVKYNFAFFDQVPDLNWDHVLVHYLPLIEKDQPDAEYYSTMKRICALLKDGHTNYFPPSSNDIGLDSPPIKLINVGGKAIVENVAMEISRAIPIGTEIISIDGVPVVEYMQTNLYPFISSSTAHIRMDWAIRDLLIGPKDSKVTLGLKLASDKKKIVDLNRNSSGEWVKKRERRKNFVFKKVPQNVSYVALNSFGDPNVVKEFETRIDSINQCRALIIDLRANGGGSSSIGYEIMNHLTAKKYVGSAWRTREHRSAFKAWGYFRVSDYRKISQSNAEDWDECETKAVKYYEGQVWYKEAPDTIVPPTNKKVTVPFIVLIGHNTASAAEDFLIALDDLKIAKTVGTTTFGSTGQPLILELPGRASARICTKRDEYPDGRQFVGYGIKPDIYIENTVPDLINGTDSILAKALEIVLKKK